METIKQFKTLLTEYRKLENTFWQECFEADKSQFKAFQQIFRPFDARMQELLTVETPFYNVFDILNVSRYEEKVHTPFICHLLNPKASHEQKALFLDIFLRNVLELPMSYKDFTFFTINEELSTTDGRIDIIIEFKVAGRSKAIIIENKIYAGDQESQLERYHNYLVNRLHLNQNDVKLIYLTPQGTKPGPLSISPNLAKELRGSGQLVEIGYRQHIIPWLIDCYQKIKSPRVQQILHQYIKTIESL